MAGFAGVMFAYGSERFSNTTFDPTFSILVVSMVVIGGLDSITGALLGAIYLIGLPALFGANADIQFLTSGLGLLAFVLYLPGGMAEVLHRFGDLVAMGVTKVRDRAGGAGGAGAAGGVEAAGDAGAPAANGAVVSEGTGGNSGSELGDVAGVLPGATP
jgi:hypothetical protein